MSPSERRSVPVEVIVLGAVLAVGAVAVDAGWLDGLTLDSHGLALIATGVAGVLLAVVVVRPERRWWTRTLPLLVLVTAGFEAAMAWYVRASQTVTDPYPRSFLIWIGAPLLAAGAVAATWRRTARPRRTAGLLAVPVTVVAAFLLINAHYGYWPTVGDLVSHPVANQIDAATLGRELSATAGATGRSHTPGSRASDAPTSTPASTATPPPGHHRAVLSPLSSLIARSGMIVTRGSLGATTSDPHRGGQFALVDIPSTVSHFAQRAGGIYLPPAYFTPMRSQLGVLIMLAGTPSSPNVWATAGHALATADAYAADHDGQAPVMLFVDANGSWSGDTECVDGPRGQAETYLTVDVVHYATAVLHLSADPDHWGVVGFSEGGTCALDLALRHPTLFHHFVDLGGDAAPNLPHATVRLLYGGSTSQAREHTPSWLMDQRRYQDLSAWFGSGRGDGPHLLIGEHQDRQAVAAGMRSQWFAGPGGHNWQFCTWALRRVLPSLATQVGPTRPPKPARVVARRA